MRQQNDGKWMVDLRRALVAPELVEPPAWVRERARAAFQSHTLVAKARRGLFTRIRAALVFDSRRSRSAPAGVRAGSVLTSPWQLLYRGGDVDIDLMVRPNQDGRTMSVRGQALALGGGVVGDGTVELRPARAPRQLRAPMPPAARSELEPSGEFALSNLERGRYDVLLHLGARDIELSDLEI